MLLIQNRGEEKRTWQEKELQEPRSLIKRKPRGLIIRRNMSKIRDAERLTSNMNLVCDLRMRAKNLCARETDEQSEARLEDLRMRAQNR